jgi:hypothetical protein
LNSPNPKCSALGIPTHLHSGTRPVNDVFLDAETVYYRAPPMKVEGGKVLPEAFKTTKTSVVRKRDTAGPEDCLYDGKDGKHCFDFGVAELAVGKIQSLSKAHPQEQDSVYTFKIRHDPLECMYPHCEIRTYKGGSEVGEIKPPSVKTWLRLELSRIASLVQAPKPRPTSE